MNYQIKNVVEMLQERYLEKFENEFLTKENTTNIE